MLKSLKYPVKLHIVHGTKGEALSIACLAENAKATCKNCPKGSWTVPDLSLSYSPTTELYSFYCLLWK